MQRHLVPRAKGGARGLREGEAYGRPQIPGCQGAANEWEGHKVCGRGLGWADPEEWAEFSGDWAGHGGQAWFRGDAVKVKHPVLAAS